MTAPPYPEDTRAKGWRFELDLEQVMQSDTWALAPPEARPWLLMLWTTAWQQVPCGSMPADDTLICARLGMPAKTFAKLKAVLLRGWWTADDGRMYHATITQRVVDMLARKDGERKRKADYRAQKEAERKDSASVPRDKHGTDKGLTPESHGTDDTGTGTGTGLSSLSSTLGIPATPSASPSNPTTQAEEVCKALKAAGLQSVSPSHPELLALIGQGVTVAQFAEAGKKAVDKRKGFAYAMGIVKGALQEAAAIAAGPSAQPAGPWDSTRAGIDAMADRVGVKRWDENDISPTRGTFAAYTERVREKAAAAGLARAPAHLVDEVTA